MNNNRIKFYTGKSNRCSPKKLGKYSTLIDSLAKAFHQQVIAEGVETLIHCERLIELGCDFGQGYIIARPMPSVEIPKWIAIWQENPTIQFYSNENGPHHFHE